MNINEIPTPRGAYRIENMNLDEIPTPEMDGLEINVPDTRVNAIMALNAVIGKGKDLERRLTVAREALQAVSDAGGNYCDLLTSQEIAEKALEKIFDKNLHRTND